MRWTEARQGVRMIKFLSILSRYEAAEFSQLEARELHDRRQGRDPVESRSQQ